jgi:hypothetical protein
MKSLHGWLCVVLCPKPLARKCKRSNFGPRLAVNPAVSGVTRTNLMLLSCTYVVGAPLAARNACQTLHVQVLWLSTLKSK